MIKDEIVRLNHPADLMNGIRTIASSRESNCEGFLVESYEIEDRETTPKFAYNDCYVLSIQREGVLEARGAMVAPRELVICAAGEEQGSYACRQARTTLAVLDNTFIRRAVRDAINVESVQVRSVQRTRDDQVECLIIAAEFEIRSGLAGGRMMMESLGSALAIHLLTYHASKRTIPREYGAMSKYRLRRALESIHENLGKNLSLFELASEVDMSPYYFCRLFKRSTGLSPHKYMERERIRRAQELLSEHRLTVVGIGNELGFSDQSHFARTFRRHVGVTPREFAKGHWAPGVISMSSKIERHPDLI